MPVQCLECGGSFSSLKCVCLGTFGGIASLRPSPASLKPAASWVPNQLLVQIDVTLGRETVAQSGASGVPEHLCSSRKCSRPCPFPHPHFGTLGCGFGVLRSPLPSLSASVHIQGIGTCERVCNQHGGRKAPAGATLIFFLSLTWKADQ